MRRGQISLRQKRRIQHTAAGLPEKHTSSNSVDSVFRHLTTHRRLRPSLPEDDSTCKMPENLPPKTAAGPSTATPTAVENRLRLSYFTVATRVLRPERETSDSFTCIQSSVDRDRPNCLPSGLRSVQFAGGSTTARSRSLGALSSRLCRFLVLFGQKKSSMAAQTDE